MYVVAGVSGTYSGVAPTMGAATSGVGGWTATITNYDGAYTYSATTTAGSVSISTSTITASSLTAGNSSTVTVTTTRSGYESATGTVAGTALSYPNIELMVVGGGGGGAGGIWGGTLILGGQGGGGNGGNGNGGTGDANTGSGGGGAGTASANAAGGAGGSGIVVIAYPSTHNALTTIDVGLTYSVSTVSRSGYRVYTFTAGTGNISWA